MGRNRLIELLDSLAMPPVPSALQARPEGCVVVRKENAAKMACQSRSWSRDSSAASISSLAQILASHPCRFLRRKNPGDKLRRKPESLFGGEGDVVKTVAFVFGLYISAFGAVGILVPSCLVWLAQQFVTSGVFYVVATVRIAFGLVLISAASTSRVPKAIRVLGYVILILGITTALTGLVAIEQAQGATEWWLQQGSGLERLTAVFLLALGGFVAYACTPVRRTT